MADKVEFTAAQMEFYLRKKFKHDLELLKRKTVEGRIGRQAAFEILGVKSGEFERLCRDTPEFLELRQASLS